MATTRERVRDYRERMRAQGLRPVQLWVPDTRTDDFARQAHEQSRAVADSAQSEQDQDFIDEISDYA